MEIAGQEEYSTLRDQYMRSGDGYMFVYSIVSLSTFLGMNDTRNQLYRVLEKEATDHIPICVCGNKCDIETEREVSKDEAIKVTSQWGCLFYETSAKEDIGVKDAFTSLIRDILKTQSQQQQTQAATTAAATPQKKKKGCSLL